MPKKIKIDCDSEHRYWIGNKRVPGVTEILEESGLISLYSMDEDAARRGRYVHKAVALDCLKKLKPGTIDPKIKPYFTAWLKFRRETGFSPRLVEQRVYHRALGYAGRFDLTGLLKRRYGLLGVKTGLTLPKWAALQEAAYQHAFESHNGRRIGFRWGLLLKPDGSYQLREYKNHNIDFANFRVLLTALKVKRIYQ